MPDDPQPIAVDSPRNQRSLPSATAIPAQNGPVDANLNAQLASLLADACRETDSLRNELAFMRKRAETAERTLGILRQSMGDTPNAQAVNALPEAAAKAVMECEERTQRAEQARDEMEARLRKILEGWDAVDGHYALLEAKSGHLRNAFTSLAIDGTPLDIDASLSPTPAHLSANNGRSRHHHGRSQPTLPPHPLPHAPSRVRPRPESMDNLSSQYATGPPAKKRTLGWNAPDADSQFRPEHLPSAPHPPNASHSYRQMDVDPSYNDQRRLSHAPQPSRSLGPPHDSQRPPRPLSRSSSTSSLSIDEMLLQAADEKTAPPGSPRHNSVSFNNRLPPNNGQHRRNDEPYQGQHYSSHPSQPPAQTRYINAGDSPQDYHRHPQQQSSVVRNGTTTFPAQEDVGGQMSTYQTTVFAPVVTGAPTKKTKYSSSANLGSNGDLSHDPSGQVNGSSGQPGAGERIIHGTPMHLRFPPTNEHGQRICRQCGMVGRYKEGKCVEKWGPGPMGPGTVCDRCRKKMKRIERRGTLESQQQAQQAQLAAISSTSQQLASASSTSFITNPNRNGGVAYPHPSSHQQAQPQSNNASTSTPIGRERALQRADTIPATHTPTSSSLSHHQSTLILNTPSTSKLGHSQSQSQAGSSQSLNQSSQSQSQSQSSRSSQNIRGRPPLHSQSVFREYQASNERERGPPPQRYTDDDYDSSSYTRPTRTASTTPDAEIEESSLVSALGAAAEHNGRANSTSSSSSTVPATTQQHPPPAPSSSSRPRAHPVSRANSDSARAPQERDADGYHPSRPGSRGPILPPLNTNPTGQGQAPPHHQHQRLKDQHNHNHHHHQGRNSKSTTNNLSVSDAASSNGGGGGGGGGGAGGGSSVNSRSPPMVVNHDHPPVAVVVTSAGTDVDMDADGEGLDELDADADGDAGGVGVIAAVGGGGVSPRVRRGGSGSGGSGGGDDDADADASLDGDNDVRSRGGRGGGGGGGGGVMVVDDHEKSSDDDPLDRDVEMRQREVDEELLEAVDAAEATTGGAGGGGAADGERKRRLKMEDDDVDEWLPV